MIGWAAHRDRGILLAKVDELTEEVFTLRNSEALEVFVAKMEVDRLAEVLRSIAYEGGDCLAVEASLSSLPSAIEDDDEVCGVCAVCWAREALEGGAA